MTKKELNAYVFIAGAALFIMGFSLGRQLATGRDFVTVTATLVGLCLVVGLLMRLGKKFRDLLKTLPK